MPTDVTGTLNKVFDAANDQLLTEPVNATAQHNTGEPLEAQEIIDRCFDPATGRLRTVGV
jgi:hypothetical protein